MKRVFCRDRAFGRWALPRPATQALLGVVAAALLVSGCGQKATNRVRVFKTAGRISFEGQAPDGALVVLHPKDPSPAALKPTAKVQPDGSFQLTTYETGDGAPAGQYVVTVSWSRVVQSNGDYVPGPELIPPKYVNPKTSDVQVSVAEGPNELQPIALSR